MSRAVFSQVAKCKGGAWLTCVSSIEVRSILAPAAGGGWRCANADRFMADKIMPLEEAVEGYDLFDKMKVQKVIFRA